MDVCCHARGIVGGSGAHKELKLPDCKVKQLRLALIDNPSPPCGLASNVSFNLHLSSALLTAGAPNAVDRVCILSVKSRACPELAPLVSHSWPAVRINLQMRTLRD